MGRHTDIVLDDKPYKIPTLTIDQLERISDLQEGQESETTAVKGKRAFSILKIILEEADPKIEGIARASMSEIADAINAVLNGGAGTAANPPKAAIPAAK